MELDLLLPAFTDIIGDQEPLKKELEEKLTVTFANNVAEICDQIRHLVGTEEKVNKIENEELDSWKLELMSFLRELQCPYEFGEPLKRFETGEERKVLLEFLAAELIAAKRINQMSNKNTANLTPVLGILHALNLSQPPSNIQVCTLFGKFKERIDSMPQQLKNHLLAHPLLSQATLNKPQWQKLDQVKSIKV